MILLSYLFYFKLCLDKYGAEKFFFFFCTEKFFFFNWEQKMRM